MNERRTDWVFSPREDAAVMLGVPLLCGAVLLAVCRLFAVDWYDDNDSVSFFVFVLGDHTHLYVSFAISFGFADEYRRRRTFYRLTPVVIAALLLAINAWSKHAFLTVFATYSIYHFVRQELGWMVIAAKKGGTPSGRDLRVDKLALYGVTVLPALLYMADSDEPGWFIDGDFPDLPWQLTMPLFGLWLFVLVAYPAWFVARRVATGRRNTGKLFVWAKNALLWGLTFIFLYENIIWGVAVLTVSHAAPYIYLGYKFGRFKLHRTRPDASADDVLRVIKWFYAAAVTLALLHYLVEVYPEYFFVEVAGIDPLAFAQRYLVKPLFASLTLFHFVIDGFFWQRRHNPDACF